MRLKHTLRQRAGRIGALLLLVLSIAPIVALAPALAASHDSFRRLFLGRDTEAAPTVQLSAEQSRKAVPPRTFTGAVPVLVYHGISEKPEGRFAITPQAFAAQMAMLRRAGFHTISAEQYARFPGGSAKDLPSRPILITFDDGRLDSYKHADPILKANGMRATMFTITNNVDRRMPFYLRWDELRSMRDSGRWDVQLHADALHRTVTVDARGDQGAAYANRAFSGGSLETLDAYRRRVSGDAEEGLKRLREELGADVRADLFAIPFSIAGGWQTNDPRIPDVLATTMHRRFSQVFLAGRPVHPPRTPQRILTRYEVRPDTTVDGLYGWLSTDPRTRGEIRAQAARHVERLRAAGEKVSSALLKQAGVEPRKKSARAKAQRSRAKARAARAKARTQAQARRHAKAKKPDGVRGR
jgi:peptidoglycan/xylan/chitin deacetylase (PgdA/CDA1 family)